MNLSANPTDSRMLCTITAEPRAASLPPDAPGNKARALIARWMWMLAFAHLAACASHRHAPECKGLFTPINQQSSVTADGSQP